MQTIEDAAQRLSSLISGCKADYVEARLEDSVSSYISFRGKKLETIGKSSSMGGSLRALVNGGWGFISFNSLDNFENRLKLVIEAASLAGTTPFHLSGTSNVVKSTSGTKTSNPVEIPLSHKKELIESYNALLWKTPQIQTSVIGYSDSSKKSIFLNSGGSLISNERSDITLNITAIASSGSEVQQSNMSIGSLGDFSAILELDEEIQAMSQRAVDLLSAPQAQGGEYTVVLDPILAGVFVHEAFGHLSEADFLYENPQMQELMVLGKRFGRPELNIIDNATISGLRGSYAYDDEGTPSGKTFLIKEGILTSRLHSLETATKMGEAPTGNARALSYRHAPIVRMSNTYIEPGKASFEEMISDIKEGIYAKNWYGGTTSMEMFTFSAGEAYMIRHGKVEELIRPVVLTGNVFETLMNIDAIGNDLEMNQGGGCGKGGQSPLPVSNGSPHIRIQNCLVGGK